jgi:hypothetical protein
LKVHAVEQDFTQALGCPGYQPGHGFRAMLTDAACQKAESTERNRKLSMREASSF